MARITVRDQEGQDCAVAQSFVAQFTQRDGSYCASAEVHAFSPAQVTRRDHSAISAVGSSVLIAQSTLRDRVSYEYTRLPESLAERYEVIERIVSGAEGELLLLSAKSSGDRFVLKIYWEGIAPDTDILNQLQRADSTHIVPIHEHGIISGRYYEIVEYLPDGSLRGILNEGSVTEAICRKILREINEALDYLHTIDSTGRIIVHRDVKPENLMIGQSSPLDLKLSDFGITSFVDSQSSLTVRQFTLAYTAPETLDGLFSERSDFWSLGMTMLEILNGRHPFAGLDDIAVDSSLRDGYPGSQAGFPDGRWRRLISGLLQPEPDTRWGAEEVKCWLDDSGYLSNYPIKINEKQNVVQIPFVLAGISVTTMMDLAVALLRFWDEGVRCLRDGSLFDWLREQSGQERFALVLERLVQEDLSWEIRMLRFAYTISPGLSPVWKYHEVGQSLLDHWAVSGSDRDDGSMSAIQEIYDQQVLSVLGEVCESGQNLGEIDDRWRTSVNSYESGMDIFVRQGGRWTGTNQRGKYLADLLLIACNPARVDMLREEVRLYMDSVMLASLVDDLLDVPQEDMPGRYLLLRTLWPLLEKRVQQNIIMYTEQQIQEETYIDDGERRGQNPPTVVFSYRHRPIYLAYGNPHRVVGQRVWLSWDVDGATSVLISGLGRVAYTGERVVNIGESTRILLKARGAGGRITCTLPSIGVNRLGLPAISRLPARQEQGRRLRSRPCPKVRTRVSLETRHLPETRTRKLLKPGKTRTLRSNVPVAKRLATRKMLPPVRKPQWDEKTQNIYGLWAKIIRTITSGK